MTSGFGFALHLHFIVIKVPVSFGMIRGFSTNVGAKPGPSSASWKDPGLSTVARGVHFGPFKRQKRLAQPNHDFGRTE